MSTYPLIAKSLRDLWVIVAYFIFINTPYYICKTHSCQGFSVFMTWWRIPCISTFPCVPCVPIVGDSPGDWIQHCCTTELNLQSFLFFILWQGLTRWPGWASICLVSPALYQVAYCFILITIQSRQFSQLNSETGYHSSWQSILLFPGCSFILLFFLSLDPSSLCRASFSSYSLLFQINFWKERNHLKDQPFSCRTRVDCTKILKLKV